MHKRRDRSAILLDQQVGSRVRLRRLMLKLSQTDLADGLGLSFQQIQKYEKGMNRIGAGRLQQIAHIMKVPVTFFFETPSPNPPPTVAQDQSLAKLNDFMATRDGLTLAKAFMRIGDTKLRRRIVTRAASHFARPPPHIQPHQKKAAAEVAMAAFAKSWRRE